MQMVEGLGKFGIVADGIVYEHPTLRARHYFGHQVEIFGQRKVELIGCQKSSSAVAVTKGAGRDSQKSAIGVFYFFWKFSENPISSVAVAKGT